MTQQSPRAQGVLGALAVGLPCRAFSQRPPGAAAWKWTLAAQRLSQRMPRQERRGRGGSSDQGPSFRSIKVCTARAEWRARAHLDGDEKEGRHSEHKNKMLAQHLCRWSLVPGHQLTAKENMDAHLKKKKVCVVLHHCDEGFGLEPGLGGM